MRRFPTDVMPFHIARRPWIRQKFVVARNGQRHNELAPLFTLLRLEDLSVAMVQASFSDFDA